MLNPFPIQWLALLAYFILRIGVGSILIYFAYTHMHTRSQLADAFPHLPLLPKHAVMKQLMVWWIIVGELVIGSMFLIGFYTQIAALLTIVMSLKCLILPKFFPTPFFQTPAFYALLLFSALALFITGAGAFAFDLPI